MIDRKKTVLQISWSEIEEEAQRLRDNKLRPANANDYKKFLKGFIENGGEITHSKSYPFLRHRNYYVAQEDFEIRNPIGRLVIIIPEDIEYKGGYIEKAQLCFMDNFAIEGDNGVTTYSNIPFDKTHEKEKNALLKGKIEKELSKLDRHQIEKIYEEIKNRNNWSIKSDSNDK